MSIERLMMPVMILRRVGSGEEDEYGNETSKPEEIVGKAVIQKAQRRAQEEQGTEGEVSDTLWNGYFPTGTVLKTSDAIRSEAGKVFELVGDPWDAREGSPSMWHLEANLRRVAGAGDES